MRVVKVGLGVLVAALGCAPLIAAAQADLRMVGSVSGTVVTQTRPQTLSFVVTNLGPASATNVVASSSPFAISQNDLRNL